jgi:hypothetical protein
MNYKHPHHFLQVAEAGSVAAVCREWRLDRLLAELAVHTLDLVIADVPLPSTVSVKAFSHLLGSSRLGVFASRALKARSRGLSPKVCMTQGPTRWRAVLSATSTPERSSSRASCG